jgi:hypothetical protein
MSKSVRRGEFLSAIGGVRVAFVVRAVDWATTRYYLVSNVFSLSKRTPIPIPRHTGRQTLTQPHIPLPKHPHTASLPTIHRGRRRIITMRALAIAPAAPCNLPAPEIPPAVLASPRARAFGMVICVLVERDAVLAVQVAEDVAAAPTVVFACEVGEVALAGCFVANLGFRVGLLR